MYSIVLMVYLACIGGVASERDCRKPLGMINGAIRDNQIYSASVYNNDTLYEPFWARLNNRGGYRADPKANQAWIMVRFNKQTIVTGIATQGYNDTVIKEWVVKYYLGYVNIASPGYFLDRKGGKHAKQFDGNTDSNTVVRHNVPVPETVTSISIMPIQWNTNFAIRFELYGCLADGYECISTPCQNNGTCVDLIAGYRCNCTAGFTGVNCQINIDDCVGVTCQNGGNCSDLIEDYSCDCAAGYSGRHCEIDVDDCLILPCLHGGTCKDLINDYSCTCTEWFGGKSCQEEAGFFLVVWLQIQTKVFTTDYLDKISLPYKTTAAQIRNEMTQMLTSEEGFLSTKIRQFSPGVSLTVEVQIKCLINSTYQLINTTNKVIRRGKGIFKNDYVIFENTVTTDCKPPNVTLPLSTTMTTPTDVSRYLNISIPMRSVLSCTTTFNASYHATIYSINNSTGAFQLVYSIYGILYSNTTWVIPAKALQYGIHYVKVTSHIGVHKGANGIVWGLILVGETKLISKITSRNMTYQGIREIFYLNGSKSYDPDLGPGNYKDLEFIWLCRKANESFSDDPLTLPVVNPTASQSSDHGGCYGNGVGRLEPRKGHPYVVGLDVDKMEGNTLYAIALVVKKGERTTWATKHVFVKEEIDISLVCVQNCRASVIPSERLVLKKQCEGLLCDEITNYNWTLKIFDKLSTKWTVIPDMSDYMLTYMNSPNLVTKESTLPGNSSFLVTLTAKAPGNIIDTTTYRFVTNAPPSGGRCDVNTTEGLAWLTYFGFRCVGWKDRNLPLSYRFRYNTSDGIEMVFFSGRYRFATAKLPVGDANDGYKLNIKIEITDSIGTKALVWMNVKVLEPDIDTAHIDKAIGSEGKMEKYLKDNNIEQAAQYATSVLSVVNNAQPKDLVLKKRIEIKDSIVKSWSSIAVKNLDEMGQVSAVVSAASDKKDEVSMDSQETLVNVLDDMASVLEAEAGKNKDGQEITIQHAGTGLLQGIGNLMEVAAANASVDLDYSWSRRRKRDTDDRYKNKKSISLVSKTAQLIDKVADSLVKTKELYEKPTFFKTKTMTMALDRQKPDLIGDKAIQDGDTKIVIPPTASLLKENEGHKDDFLSSQMVSMKSNPYTWDSSADYIKSNVIDLQIKSSKGTSLEISNLSKDFDLFIPVQTRTKPADLKSYFVKPSKNGSMQYHVINIPGKEYSVSIQLQPLSSVNITMYVRYGSRPTTDEYNYTTTVPDYTTCNFTLAKGYFNCSSDPYTVTISSAITGHVGIHYMGVVYRMHNITQPHNRVKRDCMSTGGRQKRALCVEVKAPPPTKSSNDLKPVYDPVNDVNYTLSVTMATCLYWNVTTQAWTSKGCRVGSSSRVGLLHCLCNHLTSFGGNFFVTPNPIDFNKVAQRFVDFDAKNFVVFIVVFGIFGLYLVALVIARRADRKDEVKAVETLRVSSSAEHHYEISIYTGMWWNNGTTANVGLKIYGHDGESDAIFLSDRYSKRKLFARASVNTFMVSLPEYIGEIIAIKLWHDNEGDNPSWYVNQVIVHNMQNETSSYVICNRWLAVDKGDGEVQANFAVSTKEELGSFSYQFSSRISKNLGDGHLWLSVATRPPHSPFTRVQRVSCCLSVLYCAMVASAMFYQFGAKATEETYKLGALRFSIRQLIIGLQSAIVIVPLNLLMVTIFRNTKPRSKLRTKRYTPKEKNSVKQPGCLPYCFTYVAWFLCVSSVGAAGTFTILYSLSWGGEIANEWLTSVLIAFVQDIGVIQPIKVVALAIMLALIMTKPIEEKTPHSLEKANLDINPHVTVEPPEGERLEEARSYSRSLIETFRAVGEIVAYVLFVFCLFVFVYQNRGYDRYRLTRSIEEIFVPSFTEIRTINGFWKWAKDDLVPGLYDTNWYSPGGPKLPEGYISSKEAFLVGMPRLRQIRLKPVTPCEVTKVFEWSKLRVTSCLSSYEPKHEERSKYNLPGWIPVRNVTIYGTIVNLRKVCPKPWRYQSSKALKTFSVQGVDMEYDGGGYVADIGYNSYTALNVIASLESKNWLDRKTTMLVVEFTVFEPSSSLFSHAKFLLEMTPPTGKPILSTKVETLSLYESQSESFRLFFVVVQILLLVFIFFYLMAEVVKLMRLRCGYFKSFWNWMDLIQLLSAITATVLFFFKTNFVSSFIQNIKANPYETTSIDYVLLWCNLELYIISIVIFVVTIKFLRLLRFNRHICQMTASMKHSFGCIATYTLVFLIDMLSFGFLGILVFGPFVREYSNLVESLRSLFQCFLGGETVFDELAIVNRVLGPLFVIVYTVSMTFILVNMFIAILNDSYESVRSLSGGKFPDYDLGIFMKSYYKRQFRLAHDAIKRKLGAFGYRTKKYKPNNRPPSEEIGIEKHGHLVRYALLSSQRLRHGCVNHGFSPESALLIQENNNKLNSEKETEPFNESQLDSEERLLKSETQSVDSEEVTLETATTASVATTGSTPELLDLISDLPESLVDDDDTIDNVREKLSNVGAILRLSKRSYRRFSTSGDKFVVEREFKIGKPVELTITPKVTRRLNIDFQ